MLPELDTIERTRLNAEAIAVGLEAVEKNGKLYEAMYEVYMHFRMKFIEKYKLMDDAPHSSPMWVEALQDAEALRDYVSQRFSDTILIAFRDYPRL